MSQRKSLTSHRIVPLAAWLCLACSPVYAQDAGTDKLIEQGNYWHAQGRDDLARDTWNKLLRIDPNQPDALYGLAEAAISANDVDGAHKLLQRLEASHPDDPHTRQLRGELAIGNQRGALDGARRAAAAGRNVEAVRQYRALFGNQPPPDAIAREYFQALAGTPDGWDEARTGLQQLAARHPDDATTGLALDQLLTYREPTRREGIRALTALKGTPSVASQAQAARRQALIWLNASAEDAPLYRAYLADAPNDQAIADRLAKLAQGTPAADPVLAATTRGFRMLDGGDLNGAENQFKQALAARKDDNDATGGIGLVRLRQEKFAEAQDYLTRASKSNPGKWRTALASATYWNLVRGSLEARQRNDLPAATKALQSAIRIDANQPAGYVALGDTLAASGDLAGAETAYNDALKRHPGDDNAQRGLVEVYTRQNKPEQAMALAKQLSPEQQAKLGGLSSVRAGQRRAEAQRAEQAGDLATAQQQLEAAMVESPDSPWVRLDLARVYQKQGRLDQARSVMNGLLITQPDLPDALYASALLSAESNDPAGGLAALDKIPAASRSKDMIALQRRLWVQSQAQQAKRLAQGNRQGEARLLLAQTESALGADLDRQPQLMAVVAGAYVDIGDARHAMQLTRRLLTASDSPSVDDRLLYASILLKTGQDAELAALLRQLQPATMTPTQQHSFDELRVAYVLRQADAFSRQKNLEAAYEVIAPVLAERPDDPKVIGTLARMYAAAGDQGQALALYRKVLQQSPDDLDTLLAAANAAAATRDMSSAETYVRQALAQAPDSPDVLAAAGRMYRVAGKNGKAEEYFRAALDAQARLAGHTPNGLPVPGDPNGIAAGRGNFNPFTGMTGGGVSPAARSIASVPAPANLAYIPPPSSAAPGPAAVGDGSAPWSEDAAPVAVRTAPGIPVPAAAYNDVPAAQSIPDPVAAAPTNYPIPNAPVAREVPAPPQRDVAATSLTSGDPILDELRQLHSEQSSSISAGAVYRTRDGEDGLGKLDDLEVPVEARFSAGNGKIVVTATPTTLDAGSVGDNYSTASRFGGGPTVALNKSISQSPTPVYNLLNEPLNQLLLTSGPASVTAFPNFNINQSQLDALVALLPADRANTPLGVAADRILGSDFFRSLLADNVESLRVLKGSALRDLTPTQLREQLLAPVNQSLKSSGSQSASGVGVSVGYENDGLRADVGTTPLGFRHTDVVGGVRYAGQLSSDFSYVANVSRRPVDDSLLSFAGARDERTGEDWGAITANGGRLDLTHDDGSVGLYGYGSFHTMDGRNVASNQRAEAGGGMYLHLVDRSTESLTAGLNLSLLHYQKNLSFFTFGQGGYFSPQRYVNLSFPLNWYGRNGRLNWQVQASAGVQSFKEDPSDYFPSDPERQADADRAVALAELLGIANTQGARAIYPGQTKTGISYNVAGSVEYQMAPQLFVGGQLELNNAQDYRQFTGGIYVRYLFDRYGAVPGLRPTPLRSPYVSGY
jgi:Tfp pilus assembly protein PilF